MRAPPVQIQAEAPHHPRWYDGSILMFKHGKAMMPSGSRFDVEKLSRHEICSSRWSLGIRTSLGVPASWPHCAGHAAFLDSKKGGLDLSWSTCIDRLTARGYRSVRRLAGMKN
jgi:hypothetical protein